MSSYINATGCKVTHYDGVLSRAEIAGLGTYELWCYAQGLYASYQDYQRCIYWLSEGPGAMYDERAKACIRRMSIEQIEKSGRIVEDNSLDPLLLLV